MLDFVAFDVTLSRSKDDANFVGDHFHADILAMLGKAMAEQPS